MSNYNDRDRDKQSNSPVQRVQEEQTQDTRLAFPSSISLTMFLFLQDVLNLKEMFVALLT